MAALAALAALVSAVPVADAVPVAALGCACPCVGSPAPESSLGSELLACACADWRLGGAVDSVTTGWPAAGSLSCGGSTAWEPGAVFSGGVSVSAVGAASASRVARAARDGGGSGRRWWSLFLDAKTP